MSHLETNNIQADVIEAGDLRVTGLLELAPGSTFLNSNVHIVSPLQIEMDSLAVEIISLKDDVSFLKNENIILKNRLEKVEQLMTI